VDALLVTTNPYYEGRRNQTGRLVWGTVWRRRDQGRWLYKRYIEPRAK
jgi:hypothetical protein